MSQTTNATKEGIIAIALQDYNGVFHYIYTDEPKELSMEDIQNEEDILQISNITFVYKWIQTIILCTEETLERIKQIEQDDL